MSWWVLVWHGLWRRPARTALTAASVAMAFLMIGLLAPFLEAFSSRGDLSGVSRLIVQPRHSITDFLPVTQAAAVDRLPGVRAVAPLTWFGGTWRDPADTFPRWAVPPERLLAVRPELRLAPQAREAFLERRGAAIVGRATADRFGLLPGQRLAIVPDIWPNAAGRAWELELVGVFDAVDRTVDLTALYFDYAYFDEYRAWGKGLVSFLHVALEEDAEPAAVAAAVDARFANSADETATGSERDYLLAFAEQVGDTRLMLSVILGAVLATIVLVSCVTTAQATRERSNEFAVMRALGFPRETLMLLMTGEVALLVALGALPGLLLAAAVLVLGPRELAVVDACTSLVAGLGAALALVTLATLPPAWKLRRLRVTDALRD